MWLSLAHQPSCTELEVRGPELISPVATYLSWLHYVDRRQLCIGHRCPDVNRATGKSVLTAEISRSVAFFSCSPVTMFDGYVCLKVPYWYIIINPIDLV